MRKVYQYFYLKISKNNESGARPHLIICSLLIENICVGPKPLSTQIVISRERIIGEITICKDFFVVLVVKQFFLE